MCKRPTQSSIVSGQLRLKDEGSTNIFHWFPVSPTYSHLGTVNSRSRHLLSTYSCGIRILSAMGQSVHGVRFGEYGVRVV